MAMAILLVMSFVDAFSHFLTVLLLHCSRIGYTEFLDHLLQMCFLTFGYDLSFNTHCKCIHFCLSSNVMEKDGKNTLQKFKSNTRGPEWVTVDSWLIVSSSVLELPSFLWHRNGMSVQKETCFYWVKWLVFKTGCGVNFSGFHIS